MKIHHHIKHAGLLMASAVVLFGPVAAHAVTQSVTANIAFDAAVTMTKNNDINFGTVLASTADTYTIDTAGTVTAAGDASHILGGSAQAGDITIKGSATQTVSILANNYGTANNGVTITGVKCAYNGGAAADCTTALTGQAAPGAAGKDLKIGATVSVDGTEAAGTTAAPTLDIVVIYG